jgi:hypothetical protein
MEEKSELLIAVKIGGDRLDVTRRSLASLYAHTEPPVNYLAFLDNVNEDCVDLVKEFEIPFINFDSKKGCFKMTEEIISYAIENDFIYLYHADDDYIYGNKWKDILITGMKGCLEASVISGICCSERVRTRFTEFDINGVKFFEVEGVIGGSMMMNVSIVKKFQWWKYLIDDTWDLRMSNAFAQKGYPVLSVKDSVCQHFASGRSPLVPGERFIGE